MTPSTSLAISLRRQEPVLGALLQMPNQQLLEHVGHAGFDFAVIDTEHGPADQATLLQHLTTADVFGLPVLVRVADHQEVARALDLGAAGIVAPHVSSVADARAVVSAARYPPAGRRGFATYSRAGGYGRVEPVRHVLAAQRDTVIFAMIEDPDGVQAAHDIAALDGISGLFVGPADLACALEVPGRLDDPRVAAAIESVRTDAHNAGASVLSICADETAARRHFDGGSDAVVYNLHGVLADLFGSLTSARPSPRPDAPAIFHRQPLILLPGMLGAGETWDGVAEHLLDIADPRIMRIDLDDSIAAMAETVLAEAPEQFALAGHSLGAIVALEVVRQAPRRVLRLALLNASARAGSDEQQAAWSTLRARLDVEAFADVAADLVRANLPPHRVDDRNLVDRGQTAAAAVGADGLARQLTAQSTRPDSRPYLSEIQVDTLVVSGAEDQVCPPALQEELVSGVPNAQHVVLAGAGHMAPMEAPVAVARAMRAWLGPSRD